MPLDGDNGHLFAGLLLAASWGLAVQQLLEARQRKPEAGEWATRQAPASVSRA